MTTSNLNTINKMVSEGWRTVEDSSGNVIGMRFKDRMLVDIEVALLMFGAWYKLEDMGVI